MDNIIARHQFQQLAGELYVDVLTLHNEQVIVITETSLAVYRNADKIGDPLGNGLLDIKDIPEGLLPSNTNPQSLVREYRSGYVGLANDAVLLVTPFHVSLFCNAEDALQGRNKLCEISLAQDLLP